MKNVTADANGLFRIRKNDQYCMVDASNRQIGECYSFIHECSEGYYLVERGVRKNLMRKDGSLVLKNWHHDVGPVKYGVFVFGDTIRKSKTNPKTRYIRGVAHVSGLVIFPMIFDTAWWLEKTPAIYAEIDDKPYLIDKNGSIIDPSMEHLPKKLAIDYSEKIFREVDEFPFKGVKGHVCEGCIYADAINPYGEGCGKLFTRGFRNRYLKGSCEYWKSSEKQSSEYEKLKTFRQEQNEKKKLKTTDVYALKLVREFISEKLDGDILKLCDFNLSTIAHDEKYGCGEAGTSEIVKAVMALVFKDTWPDISVNAINEYVYRCGRMNNYVRLLGACVGDAFLGMQKFGPEQSLVQRALRMAQQVETIGNYWIFPNKINDYRENFVEYKEDYRFRGYMDSYLADIRQTFLGIGREDYHMKNLFYKNRKLMKGYQVETGWKQFTEKMLLEDYVDENSVPKAIEDHVWHFMKGLDSTRYFKAIEAYCEYCDEVIPKRNERIIEALKTILNPSAESV